MQITIAATTLPNYQVSGTTAQLRIYAVDYFFADGLEYVPRPTSFYQSVPCTVSAGVVTIPQFTIESTTDSTIGTATYRAMLYDEHGNKVAPLMGGNQFSVPVVTPTTWLALQLYNQTTVQDLGDTYYTADQVDILLAGVTAGGIADGDKGDITVSASGTTWTVDAGLSADKLADGTTNKAFLATERTKLSGISTGATANSSDATLLARANHTGTQLAATISDFNTAALTAAPAETTTTLATIQNAAASKTTPVDADTIPLNDSAASGALKKLTWANLKAALNSLYQALLVSGTNIKTINGSSVLGSGDLTVSGGGVTVHEAGSDPVGTLVKNDFYRNTSTHKTFLAEDTSTAREMFLSGASTVGSTDIADAAVTLAKQANMATASVVYRKTAGTGAPEVNTVATLKTDLGLTGTNSGDQTSIVGITGTKAQFNTAVTDGDIVYDGAALGTPSSGTLTNCTGLPVSTGVSGLGTSVASQLANAADGSDADAVGFRGIPQNLKSAAYTTVMADAGKHIFHPAADTNARTFTIDSNANVAYEVGTAITFVNQTSQVVTIAITSDTMTLAGSTTTGSRSLAQNGIATALKVASTSWIISGTGLT